MCAVAVKRGRDGPSFVPPGTRARTDQDIIDEVQAKFRIVDRCLKRFSPSERELFFKTRELTYQALTTELSTYFYESHGIDTPDEFNSRVLKSPTLFCKTLEKTLQEESDQDLMKVFDALPDSTRTEILDLIDPENEGISPSALRNFLDNAPESRAILRSVTKLTLQGFDLHTLPLELILKCENLTELNISENSLTSLPDSLFSLSKLEVLNTHSNGLLEIPTPLWTHGNLKSINLSENDFTEANFPIDIPIALPDLLRIDLTDTRLLKTQFILDLISLAFEKGDPTFLPEILQSLLLDDPYDLPMDYLWGALCSMHPHFWGLDFSWAEATFEDLTALLSEVREGYKAPFSSPDITTPAPFENHSRCCQTIVPLQIFLLLDLPHDDPAMDALKKVYRYAAKEGLVIPDVIARFWRKRLNSIQMKEQFLGEGSIDLYLNTLLSKKPATADTLFVPDSAPKPDLETWKEVATIYHPESHFFAKVQLGADSWIVNDNVAYISFPEESIPDRAIHHVYQKRTL